MERWGSESDRQEKSNSRTASRVGVGIGLLSQRKNDGKTIKN